MILGLIVVSQESVYLKLKDGTNVINLDDKESKGIDSVSLSIDRNTAVYFASFWNDDSIVGGFYCIPFIEYMLVGKTLLDYTNLFSPNAYKRNDKIIHKYFKDKYDRKSKLWF